MVGLPTNALNLANLTSPCRGLDVLEVNLRVIAEVNNRTEIVIETLEKAHKFVVT